MQPSRFLIVDADSHCVERIGRTLTGVGYRFDHARTAVDAYGRVSQFDYTAVLIADRLPDSDGLDCFSRLRRESPDLCGLLLANQCDVSTVFSAIQYGFDRVIAKPIDVAELLQVLSGPQTVKTTAG